MIFTARTLTGYLPYWNCVTSVFARFIAEIVGLTKEWVCDMHLRVTQFDYIGFTVSLVPVLKTEPCVLPVMIDHSKEVKFVFVGHLYTCV